MSATSASRLVDLPSALDGKVVIPDDSRFDDARRAFNLAVDQRPSAVVYPESARDVAAVVRWARESGQQVTAQTTGHNASPLGSLQNTILLKTERMRQVSVDPVARTARVEAGVIWIEVLEAAAPHELAPLSGSSPNVGVAGYVLGGGISFLGRKYGLSANHVCAIELVTADGRLVRADFEHEQDLFWALRGGGGSFGIVTAIEVELFPVKEVYAGILWYPVERESEVLHAWRNLTLSERLPDDLTTIGRFLNFPSFPELPADIRGKSFVVVEAIHAGDPARADELLAPLRKLGPVNDTIATIPMLALPHLHMDPDQPAPGVADGLLIREMPEEALDTFTHVAGVNTKLPLFSVEVRHLGGAFARSDPAHGALSSIQAKYLMRAVEVLPAPELEPATRAHVESLKAAFSPWAAREMNLNFAETRRDPQSFWSHRAYDRLRRIKAAVDPGDIIRSNHPIPPTR